VALRAEGLRAVGAGRIRKAELEKARITKGKNIIAYCGTSREGSLLLFYL
jgi:hypothetical protein